MPFTVYNFSFTGNSTEKSLSANGNTTIQAQTIDAVGSLYISAASAAAIDIFEVALQEKLAGSGTATRMVIDTFGGNSDVAIIPIAMMTVGWDVTVKKLSGADRTLSGSLIVGP